MKNSWLLGFLFVILLTSCEKKEPFQYQYEANPLYTWGYAEFWGDYYKAYAIPQNVLSLSLFSTNLGVDSTGSLTGIGQYLYLEDIFLASSDTILPPGTYTVRDDADSFSITPGTEMEIDGQKFEVGAYVYFVEKNEHFSVMKFITEGTMKVSYSATAVGIDFDFILDDKTSIQGRYEGQLPYFDARFADDSQSVDVPRRKSLRAKDLIAVQ